MAGLKDLLLGADETTTITVDGVKEPLEVRKLNIKEERKYKRIINESLGKVSTTERNGFRGNGQEAKAELDIAVTGDAEFDANLFLVRTSFSVHGEDLSDVDIETKLPSDLFNKIVEQLKILNNLDNQRNVEAEVKKQ